MHKLVVFGYIPQKQNGSITGVQVAELWCTVNADSKLPLSASGSPMGLTIWSPESRVGSDWEVQAAGQVTLAAT